jgi:small subunit ribosomal protein S21
MLIVKVKNQNIEKALKELKSKVIKVKQVKELTKRKYFSKKSDVRREEKKKAVYLQSKLESQL